MVPDEAATDACTMPCAALDLDRETPIAAEDRSPLVAIAYQAGAPLPSRYGERAIWIIPFGAVFSVPTSTPTFPDRDLRNIASVEIELGKPAVEVHRLPIVARPRNHRHLVSLRDEELQTIGRLFASPPLERILLSLPYFRSVEPNRRNFARAPRLSRQATVSPSSTFHPPVSLLGETGRSSGNSCWGSPQSMLSRFL